VKMRILYIIASSKMGGAENFVYTLLKFLNSAKFEKYIVCPDGGYYTERFKSLARKALFIDPGRSFMNPGTVLRVSRFIKDNKIDIVHTMLYTSDFCGITAGLLSGRPRVLNTINGFNFLVLKRDKLRLKRRIASLFFRYIYRYSDKLVAVAEAVRQDLINRKGIKTDPRKTVTVLAAGMDKSYHDFQKDDVERLRAGHFKDNALTFQLDTA